MAHKQSIPLTKLKEMNKYFRGFFGNPEAATNEVVPQVEELEAEAPTLSPEMIAWSKNLALVEEIHLSFEQAMDNVLKDAGIMIPTVEQHEASLRRAEQLKQFGFANALEVKELNEFNEKNAEIMAINKANQDIQEDIAYFRQKYPHYKFITEQALDKILDKYSLMHAAVQFFTGVVPDKNLQDLVNHRIDAADKSQYFEGYVRSSYDHITHYDLETRKLRNEENKHLADANPVYHNYWKEMPLTIAATSDMFTSQFVARAERNGKVLPITVKDDPIVMQYVQRNHRNYLAIITAWGPEANYVVNERMN